MRIEKCYYADMHDMDFLKNFDFSPRNILKLALVGFIGILLLAIAFSFFKISFTTITKEAGWGSMQGMTAPSFGGGGVAYDPAVSPDYYYGYDGEEMASLSARNIGPILPPTYPTAGNDAEEYEVTEYSATIETGNSENTCSSIAELKSLEYVVFESANSYDRGCSYAFKVEIERVPEILAVIESFDPKELFDNTYTIKQQVSDYTAEEEILERKLASIDETLTSAVRAYNDITTLATNAQNVDALAKIIDSRLQLLERLTQERISINAQLERLTRAKEQQLDRLVYTYFNVNVYENKFVDGEALADSWKETAREFVRTVNKVLQDITINLVGLLFLVLQFVIYGFLLLIAAKYGWRIVRHIWQK